MIWVAGRSPTLVSHSLRGVAMNLKATTLTYLAIAFDNPLNHHHKNLLLPRSHDRNVGLGVFESLYKQNGQTLAST